LRPSSLAVVVAQLKKRLQTGSFCVEVVWQTEHNGPYERIHNKVQSHSGGQPSLCTLQIWKTL